MNDEKPQKHTFELVPMAYYEMFAYRMAGLTYKQIAEKTKYTEDWVRHIFAKGGALNELYRNFLQRAKEESVDEAMDMMFAHLPDIVKMRIKQAKNGTDAGAVVSSKMIMDYTLGDPRDRAKKGGGIGFTFSDWIKQQTLSETNADQQEIISVQSGQLSQGGVA